MCLSIVQWNMNGYKNNYHELLLIIKEQNPDIICIQETHVLKNSNIFYPSNFAGYFTNLHSNTIAKQGIAILVKKNIPHQLVNINSHICSLGVEISLNQKVTIVNSYIPPKQTFSSREMLNFLKLISGPIILVGDFNAWSPLWGSHVVNSRGQTIEEVILAANLAILNNGAPTHLSTHNSLTHVDLTLVTPSLIPNCKWEISNDLHGSDHFPITTTLQSHLKTENHYPPIKFKTDQADWKKFNAHCMEHFTFSSTSDVNLFAARITKAVKTAANLSIPQTKPGYRPRSVHWWCPELQKLRDEKQLKWKIYKQTGTIINLIAYKKANAIFKKSAKAAKRDSFSEFSSKISPLSTTKKIWADIKSITGTRRQAFITLKNGNTCYNSSSDIAKAFGNQWTEYSKDDNFCKEYTENKSKILTQQYIPTRLSSSAKHLECDFTLIELNLALQSAKGKTPGHDRISYPMLQNLPQDAKMKLISMYNTMLNTGRYPHIWRSAIIVPIAKPNKPPHEISSFRPISLLSCVSKIIEKMLARRLSWYITRNNFVSPNQTAFKTKHSTMDSLLHLQHYVSDALSSKNHVTVLATDFEKAYDRVGVHAVLQQLARWGVGPKVFNLVKAFMTRRSFRVRVNNTLSDFYTLHNGIPQGSPLSVVLFIIAFEQLNSIIKKHKNIQLSVYADDALLLSKMNDTVALNNIFLEILTEIKEWGKLSGAFLAINKCKVLHICKKHHCMYPELKFNNYSIECTNNLKILGIIFDKGLTFSQHCTYIRKCLFQRLSIIRYLSSIRSMIHPSTLTNITRAIMLAKIDYGLPIYGWCAASNLRRIQAPYNTAVRRSINAFPTSPIKCVAAEAGLPLISERVMETTLKLIPKFLCTTNTILQKDFQHAVKSKRTFKVLSSIRRCVSLCKQHKIDTPKIRNKVMSSPPWLLKEASINIALHQLNKPSTSSSIYKQVFAMESAKLNPKNWTWLYTDASKSNTYTSFAVVNTDGTNISVGLLPTHYSVCAAEAVAVLEAAKYAQINKGKFVVATDSLSTIHGVKNLFNNNSLFSQIRQICIKCPNKIKLFWVPGHQGIRGNEIADTAAKDTGTRPCHLIIPSVEREILNKIKEIVREMFLSEWQAFSHPYRNINPHKHAVNFPANCKRHYCSIVTRMRIGHTKISHQHLLSGENKPPCPGCGAPLTIKHILDECSIYDKFRRQYFDLKPPSAVLTDVTYSNIITLVNFLKSINLYHLV